MKLRQGQVWKQGEEYIRIVRVERLEVEYKSFFHLASKEGVHHHVSKKDFCRLLKKAVLLAASASPYEPPRTPISPPHERSPRPAEQERRPKGRR